jgi:hypothetical protein
MYHPYPYTEGVVYHPPKAVSFGHQSRIRDARIAWPKVPAFLDEFTHYRLMPWTQVTLDLAYHEARLVPGIQELAERNIEHAAHRLGPPTNRAPLFAHWILEPDKVNAAVEFVLTDCYEKLPTDAEPVRLYFAYVFLWREFWGSAAPPSQQDFDRARGISEVSSFGVWLYGRRLFLQPTLYFPVSYESAVLKSFIAKIEESLPFRLRNQYFSRWLRKKDGAFSRGFKLDKGWRKLD